MKNLFVAALACCVFVGGAYADRSTLDDTLTRVAMPLSEPPVIDGVIDTANGESWVNAGGAQAGGGSYWVMRFNENQEDYVLGANVVNGGDGPLDGTDFGADIYVGYDSEYLYVAVRVIDDVIHNDTAAAGSQNQSTWLDDSVEVFVDGDNSNHPERDTAGNRPEGWSTGGQYVVTFNNAYRENEAGNPGYGPDAPWYGLADIGNDGNLNYEFRISLSLFGDPQPGDVIGFDIAINDDDDGGDTLENQYTWAGLTHEEITYGNLILGPRKYVAPKGTATVDGVIAGGEYGSAPEINVTHHTGNYNGDDLFEVGDHDWKAWVIHDDEAIYVGVHVIDDTIVTDSAEAGSEDGSTWTDDSVELFIDSDYSKDSGRTAANLFEGQFVLTPNGAWRDNEANNPIFNEEWFAATTTVDDGYVVEFKFLKEILFELTNPLGFDIAVNDDDDGDRKTQLAWNGRPHTELSYGELLLDTGTDVERWSLY